MNCTIRISNNRSNTLYLLHKLAHTFPHLSFYSTNTTGAFCAYTLYYKLIDTIIKWYNKKKKKRINSTSIYYERVQLNMEKDNTYRQ